MSPPLAAPRHPAPQLLGPQPLGWRAGGEPPRPDLPIEPVPPAAPDVPQDPLPTPVQDPAPGRSDPAPPLQPDVGDPLPGTLPNVPTAQL